MVLIAPSLLSADFGRINEEIRTVKEAGADWIHLDVMDGRFVPNITFGPPIIAKMEKLDGLVYDAHLMVHEPDHLIEDFVKAGCQNITVHQEACTHLQRSIKHIQSFGVKAGVSLNPATGLDTLDYVLDDVDMVLLMSVNPGFGGQKYIPQITRKVAELKKRIEATGRDIMIQVDGGVAENTISEVAAAGATNFVAGTAVFGQSNYQQAISMLRSKAEAAIG